MRWVYWAGVGTLTAAMGCSSTHLEGEGTGGAGNGSGGNGNAGAESGGAESGGAESGGLAVGGSEAGGSASGGVQTGGVAVGGQPPSGATAGTGNLPSGVGGGVAGGFPAMGGAMPGIGGMSIGGRPPIAGGPGIGGGAPTDCEPASMSSGSDYCTTEYECAEGYLYLWCDSFDPSTTRCSCESSAGWAEYQLTGVGSDACSFAEELCSDPVTFTEPEECTRTYQAEYLDGCDTEYECTQSADLGDGISVQSSRWEYVRCSVGPDDVWTCDCEGTGSWLSFDLPDTATASSACVDARSICAAGPDSFGDDRTCTPTYQSAGSGYCQAEQDCTLSATVGDETIVVHDRASTWCEQGADSWNCECSLSEGAVSVELDVDMDSWSVCSDAPDLCLAEVE